MLAALVLAALVLVAGLSRDLGAGGAAALVLVSVIWLGVNGSMEGTILVVVAPTHGLTGADLAGVVGLGLAGYRGARLYQKRSREET